jgi:hypothetical protein
MIDRRERLRNKSGLLRNEYRTAQQAARKATPGQNRFYLMETAFVRLRFATYHCSAAYPGYFNKNAGHSASTVSRFADHHAES